MPGSRWRSSASSAASGSSPTRSSRSLAGYDLVVIDTPPNLGLLTVNALICADVVLAPVSCEDEASVQGLVELRATLAKLGRLRGTEPQLSTLLTRWAPGRVLSGVIERQSPSSVCRRSRGFRRERPSARPAPARPARARRSGQRVTLAYDRLAEPLEGVLVR